MGIKWVAPLLIASLCIPLQASAEEELQWVSGNGQLVDLGGLAELKLLEGYSFLNAEDTRTFEMMNGNLPTDTEIGALVPDDTEDWMVYFEYDDVGHVSDKDKTNIDADALLQSYKDGTEAANEELDEENHLFVDGWESAPHYDEGLHSLTWALIAHDVNQYQIINYNIRLLTREGYISVILVCDPDHLAASRAQMESDVLSELTIKEGKRFEDFDAKTDKNSNMGLAALVVGGAGLAVAKKAGLLAILIIALKKFGIVFVAAGAGLWRWLRGKSKSKAKAKANQASQNQEPPVPKDEDTNAS